VSTLQDKSLGADLTILNPSGIVCLDADTLYVVERNRHRVLRLQLDDEGRASAALLAGAENGASGFKDGSGTTARFNDPRDLAMDDDGNLYVADTANDRIRKVTPGGAVTTFAGGTSGAQDGPAAEARFREPYGVTVGPDGDVYVADYGNHRVRKIATAGTRPVTTIAGGAETAGGFLDGVSEQARFNKPTDVAVDTDGRIYVADFGNQRIRLIRRP
jgi:DNA-binding beta-propeller fold protein YncE